jgi:hypothetical protein
MNRLWATLFLALNLALANAAGHELMVLQSSGSAPATGSVFGSGETVQVPAGCEVTLLLLGQGKRVKVTGPCKVWLKDGRLQAPRGKVQALAGPFHRLRLTGENHRQIAAGVVRGVSAKKLLRSPLDLQVTPSPAGRLLATQSVEADADRPPTRYFWFYDQYVFPQFAGDLSEVIKAPLDRTVRPQPIQGREQDGRWHYEMDVPEAWAGRRMTLRITSEPTDQAADLLYTPLYIWSQAEAAELRRLKQETEAWAASGSLEPWVILAAAAEELGQLREALQAVQKALQKRPDDKGLQRMAARLQLDLGDYPAAQDSLIRFRGGTPQETQP